MLIQFGKTLEHTSHLFRFDSRARIRYMKYDLTIHQLITVLDTTFLRKLYRIPDQVRNHLEHTVLVRLYPQAFVRRLIDKLHTLRCAEYMRIMYLLTQIMQTRKSK